MSIGFILFFLVKKGCPLLIVNFINTRRVLMPTGILPGLHACSGSTVKGYRGKDSSSSKMSRLFR